jgi:uncharacterized protein (UPF0548 family)
LFVALAAVPILLSRPTETGVNELLEAASREPLTYPEIGATQLPELPPGYRHDHYSTRLGQGDDVFERAKLALRGWQAHRRAGVSLTPELPPLETGTNLVCCLRLGPAFVLAPCRIVYVTYEEEHFGFGYGTLPGHPECGEEAFHIRRSADWVSFEVRAFSRPVDPLARLGGLVARWIQLRVNHAYLEGLRQQVSTDG